MAKRAGIGTIAPPDGGLIVHASCVVANGRAALIRGQSGSGKSALALRLLALGAGLVADDRTHLRHERGMVLAEAPAAIRGLIEARGVGILNAPAAGAAPLALVVDMDRHETEHLPAAILAYLANGRHA